MRTRMLLIVSLLAWPGLAGATTEVDFNVASMQDLIDLCGTGPDETLVTQAREFCYGYLGGVGDYHRALAASGELQPIYCAPEDISREQARTMLVEWAETNSDRMAEPAIIGLLRAAEDLFPCP